MLKIKDNVDLKELEKFGFEITENEWFETYNEEAFEAIKEFKKDGMNVILIVGAYRRITFYFEQEKGYNYTRFNQLDVLYDLIKADLVEKVGE